MSYINTIDPDIIGAILFGLFIVSPFFILRILDLLERMWAEAPLIRHKIKEFLQKEFFLFCDDEYWSSEYNTLLPSHLRKYPHLQKEYAQTEKEKGTHNQRVIRKKKTMKTKSVSTKHICPECGFKLTSSVSVYAEIADSASVVSFTRDCSNCKGHLDIVSIECSLESI